MILIGNLVRLRGMLRVGDIHETDRYSLTARAVVCTIYNHARCEQQTEIKLLLAVEVHIPTLAKVRDHAQFTSLGIISVESYALEFTKQMHGPDVDVSRLESADVVVILVLVVCRIQERRFGSHSVIVLQTGDKQTDPFWRALHF